MQTLLVLTMSTLESHVAVASITAGIKADTTVRVCLVLAIVHGAHASA